jgi:glyoxylase-like metal-dependent hydrolase (beta-lactamase superfamily II)
MVAAQAWEELGPGTFRLVSEPFRLNVGLIVGGEMAVLIDTGASLATGRDLVQLARSVTQLALGAINTHNHFDHCFGNGAFDPDVIWSHRLCADHLRWDGSEQQREVVAQLRSTSKLVAEQLAASPVVAPQCVLDDRANLDLGDRTVALIHPGRGHTDNDIVVWLADSRLLFAGDLVEEGDHPSFEDSFPLDWPDSLASLLDLGPGRIVPGHGALVEPDFVRQQQSELAQLADLARQGFSSSRLPSEMDEGTAFPRRAARTAISRAYSQMAADSSGVWAERQPG